MFKNYALNKCILTSALHKHQKQTSKQASGVQSMVSYIGLTENVVKAECAGHARVLGV